MTDGTSSASLKERIKALLRQDLKLGDDAQIDDQMPLIGGEFDLDSLDVVLLIGSIEKEFGVKLPKNADFMAMFGSVGSVVTFLEKQMQADTATGERAASASGSDLAALLSGLPHGEPFRFVSGLERVEPGVEAEGWWELSGQESFFAGHFPGRPIVPGVLIGEALAQISGLVLAAEAGTGGMLAQLDVRFRRPVPPPARLALRSRLVQSVPPLAQFEVQARWGDDVVAEGRLTLTLSGQAQG